MPTSTTKARPAPKRKPVRGGSTRSAGLYTWATVGVIAVVVLAIVVVKVTSSSSGSFTPASSTVVGELTTIPTSVFDAVGISQSGISVTGPHLVPGLAKLDWKQNGVARPTVYYYGAEYCPYCAAERWPLIIALSRFGTFSNLGNMTSSAVDAFPSTPTFTFLKATYTSQYINFFTVEAQTNIPPYPTLQKPTATELADLTTYDLAKYYPAPGVQNGSIPFISFNNQLFQIGSSYSPGALTNPPLSRAQIAASLNPPTILGKGILVTANLLTASICQIDGQQPSAVCNSSGVRAADTGMKLKV